jgi:lipid-binding SYLF domain-containing protein
LAQFFTVETLITKNFEYFKTTSMKLLKSLTAIFFLGVFVTTQAQSDSKDKKIVADAESAKADFIKTDGQMKSLFDNAYGYVIFPNVGKGAVGVGGAAGNGAVFQKGVLIGMADMKQVTVGFQFGGQAYSEAILFENQAALDRFKQNKFEFAGEASAVAVTAGAAANIKYKNGVMVFSHVKGGLMYEASVGGQKFKYRHL